jgi:hypothetical protein
MKIQVYWNGQLLYEAHAEKDYCFPRTYFTPVERNTIPFNERVERMEKLAHYFIEEAKRKLSLYNIQDPEMYLVFESRSNSWTEEDIEASDDNYPGKIDK